jgi:hypothetical protein
MGRLAARKVGLDGIDFALLAFAAILACVLLGNAVVAALTLAVGIRRYIYGAVHA